MIKEIILKGRLDGNQRNRLVRLLDMPYSPSELSRVIGFNVRQMYRVYIPLGCPFDKDSSGRYWINGKEFRFWIGEIYQKRKLKPNEAFCLTCKRPIKMISPERHQQGRLLYYLCVCQHCGRKISKIITRGKLINDQSE